MTQNTSAAPTQFYVISIEIDRTNVPNLYFNDLTLQTYVGNATQVEVFGDGVNLDSTYTSQTGMVQYTTESNMIQIWVADAQDMQSNQFGSTSKTILKNNKAWTWSHGFDDNVDLSNGIDLFEEKGWRGTIYLIGEVLGERDEGWRIEAPAARRLLEDGWSIGSHSWGSHCNDPNLSAVTQSFDKLEEIIASTNRSDYVVTAFAAPCFIAEYHPVILEMRNNSIKDVQFNESGGRYFQIVEADGSFHEADDRSAIAIDYDERIGRDFDIEWAEFEEIKSRVDWAATNSNGSRHIWYNTGAHGFQEDNIEPVIDYIYDTYGPNGDNSVWVAPADEIYSYVLVRENVSISVTGVEFAEDLPTPIATATHTPTPSPTATNTSTPTPEPNNNPAGNCPLFQNGSFEDGFTHWQQFGDAQLVNDSFAGDFAMSIRDGWFEQKITFPENADFTLSGQYKFSGSSAGTASMGIDYLDQNNSEIGEATIQIESSDTYTPFNLVGQTAPGTRFIRLWFYADSSTQVVFDDLSLTSSTCVSDVPTSTPSPVPPVEPTSTATSTGEPLPPAGPKDNFIFVPMIFN
ncbi:MAG: hypothetical protein AAGD96_23115 [Chloroflexota bacterium]